MADLTIRNQFVAVLLKLEPSEGIDSGPVAGTDGINVEADSIQIGSFFTSQDSNEATGSLVAGSPIVTGQAATISFKSRIKGANAGYTASVKPPAHQALSACGKKGIFQAAITTAVATAGTTTTATLGTGFATTAQAYRGMPAIVTAGPNVGEVCLIQDYTAGKVATFTDLYGTAMTVASSFTIPACWTYAGTSPASSAARLIDHPSATIHIFKDGVKWTFTGCRGSVDIDIESAKVGFYTFNFTGTFVAKTDATMVSPTLPMQSAPIFVMGSAVSEAIVMNRKPLPVSKVSIKDGTAVESAGDPNTVSGFGAGIITTRKPMLSVDPLSTLTANRDTIGDLQAGTQYSAGIRVGSTATNRYAITLPLVQPTTVSDGARGALASEEITAQLLSAGQDLNTRDGDYILAFY